MNVETLKKEAKQLIAELQFPQFIELMDLHLSPKSSFINEFYQHQAMIKGLQKSNRQGLLERPDYIIKANTLTVNLLEFIGQLREEDFQQGTSASFHPLIYDPIVIITQESGRAKDLKLFFQQLRFKNPIVKFLKTYQEITEDVQVIIFDNIDLPDAPFRPKDQSLNPLIEARIDLMEAYRLNTTFDFIHYGERLFYLNNPEIRKRFQAANTKFTLYARVKELLDFIRTYGG